MNDWAIVMLASAGWVVAGLELVQLYLQRKVLLDIREKLTAIDVNKTIRIMTHNTTKAILDLKNSLLEMVDKLPSTFADAIPELPLFPDIDAALAKLPEMFSDAVKKYGASIDTEVLIGRFATVIVDHMIDAAPLMAEGLAEQVISDGKAAAGLDRETIEMMDEHPVGSFIALSLAAVQGRGKRTAPKPPGDGGGRRQV